MTHMTERGDGLFRDPVSTRRNVFVVVGLFLLMFSAFGVSNSGRGYSGDGSQVYYTTEGLLLRGDLDVARDGRTFGAIQGADGRHYSKYLPALTVVEMPFFLIMKHIMATSPLNPKGKERLLRAWVPILTNLVLTSLALVVFYQIVNELGYGRRVALATTVLLAFTTPIWVYAGKDLAEPLQALCLLLALWPLVRVGASFRGGIWTACALAVLYLSKPLFVLVVPCFWIAWLVKLNIGLSKGDISKLVGFSVAYALPLLAALLISLFWNWLRFGDWLQFGFPEPFNTPLLVGLHGWFFSPGKSVFLYAPLLILSVVFCGQFYQQHKQIALLIVGISVPIVIAYCLYWAWHGDWAWAARYSVPLTPLWFLPIASVIASGRRFWLSLVAILGVIGVFVQILGVMISPGRYLNVHVHQILPSIPGEGSGFNQSAKEVHFIPEYSPLAGHWWLLKGTIEHMRYPNESHANNRALHNYPWAFRTEGTTKRLPHPEDAIGLDPWVINPPGYMGGSRYWSALKAFSVSFVVGALFLLGPIIFLSRARARWRHENAEKAV